MNSETSETSEGNGDNISIHHAVLENRNSVSFHRTSTTTLNADSNQDSSSSKYDPTIFSETNGTALPSFSSSSSSSVSLLSLCLSRDWSTACERAFLYPEEACSAILVSTSSGRNSRPENHIQFSPHTCHTILTLHGPHWDQHTMASTPLALACRYGAPYATISAIVLACKPMIRRSMINRGTPLHEAILCKCPYSTFSQQQPTIPFQQKQQQSHHEPEKQEDEQRHDMQYVKTHLYMMKKNEWMENYEKVLTLLLQIDEELEKEEWEEKTKRLPKEEMCDRDTKDEPKDCPMSQSFPFPTTTTSTAYQPIHAHHTHDMNQVSPMKSPQHHDQVNTFHCQHKYRRATLTQDVDGDVPLHLLIRQPFLDYLNETTREEYLDSSFSQHCIFPIVQKFVMSSPESVAIPDHSEYEETPLILALKSSLFIWREDEHALNHTIANNHNDDPKMDRKHMLSIEKSIFEICKIMLAAYPAAASIAAATTGYTGIHSAVFHGRCSDTIRLLLHADEIYRNSILRRLRLQQHLKHKDTMDTKCTIQSEFYSTTCSKRLKRTIVVPIAAAMKSNSLGESPLHFAAMRGECTRTISMLSRAAPGAVLQRDVKLGMTPLHWLFVRFFDLMLDRYPELFKLDTSQIDDHPENKSNRRSPVPDDDTCLHSQEDLNSILEESEVQTNVVLPLVLRNEKFQSHFMSSCYDYSSSIYTAKDNTDKNDSFDLDYHVRTYAIDPPVTYTRMRYVPSHYLIEKMLVQRVCQILQGIRKQHDQMYSKYDKDGALNDTNSSHAPFKTVVDAAGHNGSPTERYQRCPFVSDPYPISSILAGRVSLFWAKVTSLLHAAYLALNQEKGATDSFSCRMAGEEYCIENTKEEDTPLLLHIACYAPCCPPSIVYVCTKLYPDQLATRDRYNGRLPLHNICCREWFRGDFTGEDRSLLSPGVGELPLRSYNSIIEEEPQRILRHILSCSPPYAAKTYDNDNRLPLHCAIDTIMRAASTFFHPSTLYLHQSTQTAAIVQNSRSSQKSLVRTSVSCFETVFKFLRPIIRSFPDALERRDGKTGLYPFMQVATFSFDATYANEGVVVQNRVLHEEEDKFQLSLIYELFRGYPFLIASV